MGAEGALMGREPAALRACWYALLRGEGAEVRGVSRLKGVLELIVKRRGCSKAQGTSSLEGVLVLVVNGRGSYKAQRASSL